MIAFDKDGFLVKQKVRFKIRIDEIDKIEVHDLKKNNNNKIKSNKKR